VGASLLSGYFKQRRGAILALNTSFAAVGSFVAPLVAAVMLMVMDWRTVLLSVAGVSALVGIAYLFFGNNIATRTTKPPSKGAGLRQGLNNYRVVLRNRNMLVVSMLMMMGAAGRGGGINDLYLIPHMVRDLGLTVLMGSIAKSVQQFGGILGPLGFGWLSDRVSRKRTIQASLALSAISSWIVAWQGPSLIPLFLSLFAYGAFTHSRMTLTMALVADSVGEEERVAAFSAFFSIGSISAPVWALATGFMMHFWGFSIAFSVLAATYIIGILLMSLIEEPSRETAQDG
jgi:MFS family permease